MTVKMEVHLSGDAEEIMAMLTSGFGSAAKVGTMVHTAIENVVTDEIVKTNQPEEEVDIPQPEEKPATPPEEQTPVEDERLKLVREIKELGGVPAKRAGVKKLKAQLSGLIDAAEQTEEGANTGESKVEPEETPAVDPEVMYTQEDLIAAFQPAIQKRLKEKYDGDGAHLKAAVVDVRNAFCEGKVKTAAKTGDKEIMPADYPPFTTKLKAYLAGEIKIED